ncbi:hypothetical protein [Rhizobium sp. NLR22b]|uniref:hypothetical protein n=1 Tax=Rhizobium sp. NLR22b TaxID=2731115 RepID=UPI001C82BD41|nr:hypothetical protein [Rhizobium sp. NLR22b]MBX5239499.1 hypothetical protein [Rhizobium sp. NLR22b]
MSQAANFSVPTTGPASPTLMATRMDDSLRALLSGNSGASRPSYAADGTFWVSTATAGKRKVYFYDGSDDNLFQTLDIATGKITYGDGTSDDAISAALSASTFLQALKWRSRGIGEVLFANTAITGADVPPSSTTDTVWIELTSGLTGVGAFNNGKLTTESVSGSAPLVLATAVINYAPSPMNGQTIRLINTESRILRPSISPGTIQDDAFQGHRHSISSVFTGGAGASVGTVNNAAVNPISVGDPTTDLTNGTPRTANETRMKNIGVKAYMRIA